MIDPNKTVTVGELIDYAAEFNEEIRLHGIDHDYVRAQIDLIIDAAGLVMEDAVRREVFDLLCKKSDESYRHGEPEQYARPVEFLVAFVGGQWTTITINVPQEFPSREEMVQWGEQKLPLHREVQGKTIAAVQVYHEGEYPEDDSK